MFLKAVLLRLIQMDFRTFQSVLYTGSTWGELVKYRRLRAPPAESLFRRTEVGLRAVGISNLHPSDAGAAVWGDHAVVSPSGRTALGWSPIPLGLSHLPENGRNSRHPVGASNPWALSPALCTHYLIQSSGDSFTVKE